MLRRRTRNLTALAATTYSALASCERGRVWRPEDILRFTLEAHMAKDFDEAPTPVIQGHALSLSSNPSNGFLRRDSIPADDTEPLS